MDSRSQNVARAFEIFKASSGELALADLNLHLAAEGLSAISKRSYSHLGNLLRFGIEEYWTINAFDQWRKEERRREERRREARVEARMKRFRTTDTPGPIIRRLEVSGIRSIEDAELDCGTVNVLIGPNGCGKSGLLEAIGLLGATARGSLDTLGFELSGMRLGGPAEYLSKLPGASGQAILSATSDGEETSSYQVELSRLDEDWDVRAERVSAPNMPSLIRVGQEVTSWLPGSSAPLVAGPDQGMALATVPPSYANGEARAFLQNLGRFAIYQAVTNILRGVSPDPSKAEPIGLSGGGLPEAVEDMLIDPSEAGLPETHASLSDLLGWAAEAKVMDRTELSMSSSLHTGARVLAFRDHHLREGQQLISAYDASEGALYLLFLSVLARHPAVPALFALEHPDAAMHPRLGRRVLGDFFRTLVQSPRPRQVFLTTHSPLVLDCLPEDGDDYRLFAVDRSPRGVTVIRPVPFREALKRGAARGYPRPLSELWLTGALGGVPSL